MLSGMFGGDKNLVPRQSASCLARDCIEDCSLGGRKGYYDNHNIHNEIMIKLFLTIIPDEITIYNNCNYDNNNNNYDNDNNNNNNTMERQQRMNDQLQ